MKRKCAEHTQVLQEYCSVVKTAKTLHVPIDSAQTKAIQLSNAVELNQASADAKSGRNSVDERSVSTVYRAIDKASYLDWGLTSDWEVHAPSNTRSERRRQQSERQRCQRDCPNRSGHVKTASPFERRSLFQLQGDAASEGYGEITRCSVAAVLQAMRNVHELDHDSSSFLDVGSGYGKVVLHTALATPCECIRGYEYVHTRHAKAASVLQQLLTHTAASNSASLTEQARECLHRKVLLSHTDALTEQAGLHRFSHVYAYDKVFSEHSMRLMVHLLQRADAQTRVLASFRSVAEWRRLGLSAAAHCASVKVRTTGGQSFTVYIMALNSRAK